MRGSLRTSSGANTAKPARIQAAGMPISPTVIRRTDLARLPDTGRHGAVKGDCGVAVRRFRPVADSAGSVHRLEYQRRQPAVLAIEASSRHAPRRTALR
jgi:hypothetical protein